MTPESLEALIQFFVAAYGEGIRSDATLIEALDGVFCRRFSLGETVDSNFPPSGFQAVLLAGRIRVLQASGSQKNETRLMLGPGDIWDFTSLDLPQVKLLVSTDSLICQLPSAVVQQNPVLNQAAEQLKSRAVQPVAKNVVVNQPLHVPPTMSGGGGQFSSKGLGESYSAESCLDMALAYFEHPAPDRQIEPGQLSTLDDLSRILLSYGFKTKDVKAQWKQYLNTDFPFVLLDSEGQMHFIVGRKGNSLIERISGEDRRLQIDIQDPTLRLDALLIKRPSKSRDNIKDPPFSMGWYVRLCMDNYMLSAQMVIAAVITQFFNLGMPIFYMVIFDRVFGRSNLNTLDVMALGLLMLMVFDFTIKLLRSYVLSHHLEYVDKTAMSSFLHKVFDIPLSKTNPQLNRMFNERFPEMVKMNQVLISTMLVTSLEVLFSVIIVVFLLLLHPLLAFISLSSLIPMAILNFYTAPQAKQRAADSMKDQRVCQVKLSEVMENRETVESLNAGRVLKWQIADKIEEFLHKGFGARFDRVNGPAGQAFIAQLGSIVTLYFGAHEVLQGEISYGVYMAINMLGRQVVGSFQKLFASILMFQESMATLEQFKNLYAQEEEEERVNQGLYLQSVAGHIRAVDVSFRYQPDAPWALKDVNFEIQPGQKVVLTGKSGSGKTTLLRLLQRLYEPANGHVALDGFNIADMDVVNLRNHIGVALQKPAIFSGTIHDNIALGSPHATKKEIVEAATMAQLDDVILKLPKGLETPLAVMGANLSGGQTARIAMARVLLRHPSILVLDEALAACDPTLHAQIFTLIFERYKQSTCIFVTDYLPVHERADQILVLNEGQIVEQGTFRELVQRQGYYLHLHQGRVPTGR